MLVVETIQEYLDVGAVRGLKPSTLKVYRRILTFWARSMPAHLEQLSRTGLLRYFADYAVKPKTKRNALALVKDFLRYAVQQGYLAASPAEDLPLPKWEWEIGTLLKKCELEELISLVRRPRFDRAQDEWYACRNVAIVLFLADTGVRISEACAMEQADVEFDTACGHIAYVRQGKGGKSRWVVFTARTAQALREHWALQVMGQYVFENAEGRPCGPQRIRDMLHRFDAAIGKNLTPHVLRRTYATVAINYRAPLTDVQAQMGHKSIKTTALYVGVDLEGRAERHLEPSPVLE